MYLTLIFILLILPDGISGKIKENNIKKPPKLTSICDIAQHSKCIKVSNQTTKTYQKGDLFFYIPIIPLFF
jgi:hypothetical protein